MKIMDEASLLTLQRWKGGLLEELHEKTWSDLSFNPKMTGLESGIVYTGIYSIKSFRLILHLFIMDTKWQDLTFTFISSSPSSRIISLLHSYINLYVQILTHYVYIIVEYPLAPVFVVYQ